MKCPKCQHENPETTKFCGECGTRLELSQEPEIGITETMETSLEELTTGATFADRYQIIEELGKGGMGRVYKVYDTQLNEKVALKLIKPEIASDKKVIARFANELKLARKISHPGVGRMYELMDHGGTRFITMEYVPGEDLKSMIRMSGQLGIGTAIGITKQVCEGLTEAHRLGVIHRDLKPSNIMIDKAGQARIMDFGIARSVEAKKITGAGVMIGTPEYMSPEQVEGKETDQRSDIYSLGIILYEMLTGRVPFAGDTPFTVGVKHKSEAPEDPKKFNSRIPDDLNQIVLKCLEKKPEDRFQTTGEICSEFTRIEEGLPITDRTALKPKPATSKQITVSFTPRKLIIPAAVLAALLLAIVMIWKPWAKKIAQIPLSDKPSLAVMYFMNQTGDEALDHWRAALSQWLITDLSQSKYISILSADGLFSVLRKLNLLEAESYASEDLKNVAREASVNHILQASLSKAGDIFRIDYSLQRADTLEIIATDYVTGNNEESFPSLVDDMTKNIKANLDLSEDQMISDIDSEAGMITTNSPDAFKYYSIGRKYHLQGEYRKGIELMEQAIAIDPEFAMAYRSMAIAYSNLNRRTKAKEIFKTALKLTERLSDRERYRIEADFYSRSEITYDKAFEAYEKLLEIYPDETGARHNLALLYSNIEERQKAIEQYEILINKYGTDFVTTYINLAGQYEALGIFEKAKAVYEEYLNNFPDNNRIRQELALHHSYQGKYDLALEEMDRAFALAPTYWLNFRRKGDICLNMGDLKRAEEEYRKLLEKEEPSARAYGMQRLGQVLVLRGRFKDTKEMAKRGLEQAEELGEWMWIRGATWDLAYAELRSGNPNRALELLEKSWNSSVENEDLVTQRITLNRKALIYVEMGRLEDAKQASHKLKEMIEQQMNKNLISRYYHLMGMIEIEGENYSKAIEYFEKGLPLLSHIAGFRLGYAYALGRAYYKLGDLKNAQDEYERIDSLTTGRLSNGDIYAKSFYMLGKIYEQQGNRVKAIENYEKFLDLWKDADPALPEVEDARKRLAGLKGNG